MLLLSTEVWLCKNDLAARRCALALKPKKFLDDKHVLVELHLIERKINHALKSAKKSKANTVVMASIDMQSDSVSSKGCHYKTPHSCVYEACKCETMG